MTYLGAGLALSASAVPLVPDADTAPFFTDVPAAAQGRQPGSTAAVGHPCCGPRRTPKVPSCSAEAASPRRVQNHGSYLLLAVTLKAYTFAQYCIVPYTGSTRVYNRKIQVF